MISLFITFETRDCIDLIKRGLLFNLEFFSIFSIDSSFFDFRRLS